MSLSPRFLIGIRQTAPLTRLSALCSQLDPPFHPRLPHSRPLTMAPLPKTMKGVLISKTGGSEVLEHRTDLPVPTLKEGQVLVKNEYIGINYIDTYFRSGLYSSPMPLVLGREASGTIVEIGPGKQAGRLAVNDRVVWLGTESYAEFSAAPSEKVLKIPEGVRLFYRNGLSSQWGAERKIGQIRRRLRCRPPRPHSPHSRHGGSRRPARRLGPRPRSQRRRRWLADPNPGS